ncbi:MAG: DUF3108 domain-containing protein [Planctomycetota bacterium]
MLRVPLAVGLISAVGFGVCSTAFAQPDIAPAVHSEWPLRERLVYEGRVEKAGLWLTVGQATFTANRADNGELVLQAEAKGKKFGYTLDTKLTSRFAVGSDQPFIHTYSQKGSEEREKKLMFEGPEIAFWRLKHCRQDGCTEPGHEIKKTKWVGGLIPWGKRREHCSDRHCGIPTHQVWVLRHNHQTTAPHVDYLTAIYKARHLDFSTSAEPQCVRVVSDTDLWVIRVSATREETIETPAGKFETIKLVLDPQSDSGEVKKEFEGLFGLNGAIGVWVDRETHRPVRVQGQLPFAFLNLHAIVELIKVEEAPAPAVNTAAETGVATPNPIKHSHE